MKKPFLVSLLIIVAQGFHFASASTFSHSFSEDNELPTIGNTSSSLVSIEQERRLGHAWLRALRQQAATFDDPFVDEYMYHLIYSLAPNSSVIDRDFRIIVLDSPALNAFAVPGSIIGVNAGLFLHAGSEQEFAAVMAHELAHLGQRHYARTLEQRRNSTPLALAGILASVVIAATAGSDAGVASLAATQALNIDQQLKFSRQNEQEADRLGIDTLYHSNYDPRAMPQMFGRMFRKSRTLGDSLPEYLSTHPLSENRISDTANRAVQYLQKTYRDSLDFHLCRNIVAVHYAESSKGAAEYFKSVVEKGNTAVVHAAEFGLAYATLESEPQDSRRILSELTERYPGQLTIQIIYAKSLHKSGMTEDAIDKLKTILKRNPRNYPASLTLYQIQLEANLIKDAEQTLLELSRSKPSYPNIWYQLAEIHGLAGNISQLHRARAEYFFLTNRTKQAIEQLELAKKKTQDEQQASILIEQRLKELRQIEREQKF